MGYTLSTISPTQEYKYFLPLPEFEVVTIHSQWVIADALTHSAMVLLYLIFTEKFSPLPGFEPGTSPVPSRYATNWAILAWICCYSLDYIVTRLFTQSVNFGYNWLLFDHHKLNLDDGDNTASNLENI